MFKTSAKADGKIAGDLTLTGIKLNNRRNTDNE